jgi:hypothetical protein
MIIGVVQSVHAARLHKVAADGGVMTHRQNRLAKLPPLSISPVYITSDGFPPVAEVRRRHSIDAGTSDRAGRIPVLKLSPSTEPHQSGCSMRRLAIATTALALAGCGGPTWPGEQFPTVVEVERTLFAGGGGPGFRETCEAMVVQLTAESATRIISVRRGANGLEMVPPAGWSNTPIGEGPEHSFYAGAFGGCNDRAGRPPGDLPGALTRPGAFYKVVNGGEGIAIIVPRAQLAGFFYFG